MADELSYPTTQMSATASTLHTLLDNAWVQHVQQLNTSIIGPATRLGNKVAEPFCANVHIWDQQMQECYQTLHDLATALETGAVTMRQEDQNVAQGFQREGQ